MNNPINIYSMHVAHDLLQSYEKVSQPSHLISSVERLAATGMVIETNKPLDACLAICKTELNVSTCSVIVDGEQIPISMSLMQQLSYLAMRCMNNEVFLQRVCRCGNPMRMCEKTLRRHVLSLTGVDLEFLAGALQPIIQQHSGPEHLMDAYLSLGGGSH